MCKYGFLSDKGQLQLMWQGKTERQKEKDEELQVAATEVKGGRRLSHEDGFSPQQRAAGPFLT